MTGLRAVRYVLWGLVGIAVITVGLILGGVFKTGSDEPEPANANVAIGAPFTLVTNEGVEITEAAFRDHPSLVFFGFTFCPDVCPTALAEVSGWLAELGPEAEDLQVYFVTVDPERDTPERLDEYLSVFDPRIVGVTGSVDDVHAMLDSYFVYYERQEAANVGYLMDHTSSFYLLDRDGDSGGFIAYNEPRDAALDQIRRLLDEG